MQSMMTFCHFYQSTLLYIKLFSVCFVRPKMPTKLHDQNLQKENNIDVVHLLKVNE